MNIESIVARRQRSIWLRNPPRALTSMFINRVKTKGILGWALK